MITDYEVVYGHDIWDLQSKVKGMLPDGWQPFSGLQVSTPVVDGKITPFYAQVMVRTRD
jgi:hypothetical protein